MSPTIDDAHLLTAWQQGHDSESFRVLCERHAGLIEAACRRQGSPDVAEAVQAVFLTLARRADAVSGTCLGGWLTTTAQRVVKDQHRSAARRRRHEQEASMAQAQQRAAADVEPVWVEARQHLDAALDSLSAGRREAILRFYLAGRPQAEVAAELGCSVAAVKMRVHEGLEGLRVFFARKGIALGGVALASGLASEATASDPTLVASCVQTVLTPAAAPGAAALANGVIKAMIIKTATLIAAGFVLAGSCLTAALVVGADSTPTPVATPTPLTSVPQVAVRPASPADSAAPPVAPVAPVAPPVLTFFSTGGMIWSLSPDRPSEASGVRMRYEAVRLECERLSYRLAALAGAPRPVLSIADLVGGPDGRVLFDSTASQLPQVSFHGVLRPRSLNIRRLDPDPARPSEVRFHAEAIDLGDIDGVMVLPTGPCRHLAWADRALLEFVCMVADDAAIGLDTPRLVAMHFYGRSQPDRPATVLRLPPGAPAEPAQVEPLLASHGYEMRASGAVISLYFDAAGALETIKGVEDVMGDPQVLMHGPTRPILGK